MHGGAIGRAVVMVTDLAALLPRASRGRVDIRPPSRNLCSRYKRRARHRDRAPRPGRCPEIMAQSSASAALAAAWPERIAPSMYPGHCAEASELA